MTSWAGLGGWQLSALFFLSLGRVVAMGGRSEEDQEHAEECGDDNGSMLGDEKSYVRQGRR